MSKRRFQNLKQLELGLFHAAAFIYRQPTTVTLTKSSAHTFSLPAVTFTGTISLSRTAAVRCVVKWVHLSLLHSVLSHLFVVRSPHTSSIPAVVLPLSRRVSDGLKYLYSIIHQRSKTIADLSVRSVQHHWKKMLVKEDHSID